MSNVAELRGIVADLKDNDGEQEASIKVLDTKFGAFEKTFEKHEANDAVRHTELLKRFDDQWGFVQKLMLAMGGGMVSIILALLGLIGARPDILKSAMAGTP